MRSQIKKQLSEIGKMPPQACELEEAILGACMLEMEVISEVADILRPESFYKESHGIIYAAILQLFKNSTPVDNLTVVQTLKKNGNLDVAGGAYYISQLTGKVSSSASVSFNCRIVQQKFIQRELIRISSEAIRSAYDEQSDCFDILDVIEKELTAINKDFEVGKIQKISSLWAEVKSHNQVLLQKKGITGVPSGYDNLDTLTGGWQSPDLIIIAARPAMGKTSLACNFARNACVDFGRRGAIFSLEMSSRQIATRIFSLESNVTIKEFTRRGIADEQMIFVEKDCERLINVPLFIDDTPSITIQELRSKARKLKREHKIDFIVVDYLQLMSGDKNANRGGNREQEISGISRGLKALAKELQIPIIALSQLSRAVETRGGDKRPILSDLRESGAIEQDADIVIFLHRPEYYGIFEYQGGESTLGLAEIIFAKHRNGATGTEKLKFIDRLTKFTNIETLVEIHNTYQDWTAPKKDEPEDMMPI